MPGAVLGAGKEQRNPALNAGWNLEEVVSKTQKILNQVVMTQ